MASKKEALRPDGKLKKGYAYGPGGRIRTTKQKRVKRRTLTGYVKDAGLKAKPPGKRKTGKGAYYERRDNRSDARGSRL